MVLKLSLSPQKPQAALHVPNVRAECLLKFQLRPVMEWQRLVCPSIPPNLINIALKLGALPCHRKQSRMDHCIQPLSSLLTSSYTCQDLCPTLFLSGSAEAYQDVKRLCFPRQCFCRQRSVSSWLCIPFIRDAIPSCKYEEFVREASEIPNFLEEVEKCKKICSSSPAESSGQFISEETF